MGRKRKRTKAKPRTIYVTLDMGKPVSANGFFFDPKTSEFSLLNNNKPLKPEKVTITTGYDRKKGFKVLKQGQIYPEKLLFSNPNRMLEEFDTIYAIDTNTKIINSMLIAVTGIVGGQNLEPCIPSHTAIRFRPLKCFEFRNPTGKVENLGWKVVIEGIQNAPNYDENDKIACIVDSDLGNIDEYNSFAKAIYEDFYLPKNFQLIYASSDSGKENIANRMLALADDITRDIFEMLEKDRDDFKDALKVVNNKPYSHFRVWEPIEKRGQVLKNQICQLPLIEKRGQVLKNQICQLPLFPTTLLMVE